MTIPRRQFLLLGLLAGVVCAAAADAQSAPTTRIRLSRDSVVAGVRCAATGKAYAELYSNGGLLECPIAADSVIAGHALPRGTWIWLHEDRGLNGVWLLRDTELQGLPCKGAGYKGWAVRFHADGKLSLCYLSREATIDGVPCRAGKFTTELSGSTQVQLHPNGRLRTCRLADAVTRNGATLRRGDRIVFSAAGEIVRSR